MRDNGIVQGIIDVLYGLIGFVWVIGFLLVYFLPVAAIAAVIWAIISW